MPAERCRRVRAAGEPSGRDPSSAFRESLDNPIGSPPLDELARNRTVTYLVDDADRSEPREAFVQSCLSRMRKARLVRAVLTTGSHDTCTEGNKRIVEQLKSIASQVGVRLDVVIHDSLDGPSMQSLGRTPRGTPVEANARALECDMFVVNSEMKNHYFAGYSNALKNFQPGICSYRSIEANHSLALDARSTFGIHPFHPDPARRDNPCAQDMLDAAGMMIGDRDVFVLADISTSEQTLWSAAGGLEEVVREGIAKVDEVMSVRLGPCSRAIVCPGKGVEDRTLYDAQRGLELSKNALLGGAEVLLVAACREGIAPSERAKENFYDRLARPLDEVRESIEGRYFLYSHKTYKFAAMLQNLGRLHMFAELDEETLRMAHITKCESPQKLVDEWLEQSGEPILIVEDAGRRALYALR